MNDVDVVVLDHDGGDLLRDCLRSIELQTVRAARVIVVDNGSREPVGARVSDPAMLVIRSERNLGFSGGINLAMERVEAPLVAWVNNDVTLDPNWLEVLGAELAGDSGLAAVQSIVMRRDGRVDGAGITIDGGVYRQVGHGAKLDEVTAADEPWGVSATAAIYRVEALRAVSPGGAVLDPRFFAWYEDVELCARLRAGGWSFRVVPRPFATHVGSATSAALGPRAERLRVTNRYRVARSHQGVGHVGALLFEDARRSAGLLARGRLAGAARIVWWALEGSLRELD